MRHFKRLVQWDDAPRKRLLPQLRTALAPVSAPPIPIWAQRKRSPSADRHKGGPCDKKLVFPS
jgi:hypothetical protein